MPARVFAGQRQEAFAVNLGVIFDLVNAPVGVITDTTLITAAAANSIQDKNVTMLALDNSLLGGIDGTTPLALSLVGGGAFSLAAFDHAFFDLGFGANPGTLSVTGLFNGVQVAAQTFALGNPATASFGAAHSG